MGLKKLSLEEYEKWQYLSESEKLPEDVYPKGADIDKFKQGKVREIQNKEELQVSPKKFELEDLNRLFKNI